MKKVALSILILVPALAVVIWFFFPGVVLTLAQRSELAAAGLSTHEVEAAGHRIVYLDGGQGEPLLLLHGYSADKSNWVRVAKYLTPTFRVIAPDLPGFGNSTQDPKARYAIADQVERVHAFTRAIGLESFHLGGNSMGGQISGAYAAQYPQDVKSLWLLAPGGVFSAKKSELAELIEKGDNPLLVDDVAGFDRVLSFVFVEVPPIPGPIRRYLSEQAIVHRAFNEKIGRDLFENAEALEPRLDGLPVPTLIVWGDHDRLLDVSGAEILHAKLPNSKVVIFENVGHIPMLEQPERSARDFLEFHRKAS